VTDRVQLAVIIRCIFFIDVPLNFLNIWNTRVRITNILHTLLTYFTYLLYLLDLLYLLTYFTYLFYLLTLLTRLTYLTYLLDLLDLLTLLTYFTYLLYLLTWLTWLTLLTYFTYLLYLLYLLTLLTLLTYFTYFTNLLYLLIDLLYLLTHLLTYLLTPWSPSWEANWFSASQEIPRIFGTRKSIAAFTSARHLSLSWASSIQSIPPTSLFLKIHLNIILPSTPDILHALHENSAPFILPFRYFIWNYSRKGAENQQMNFYCLMQQQQLRFASTGDQLAAVITDKYSTARIKSKIDI